MSQAASIYTYLSTNVIATDLALIDSWLDALMSSNSGSSAPSNTVAGMPWLDTTNHLVKIRNEADSAWMPIWDTANGKPVLTNLSGDITGAMIASAIKDAAAGTASLRTLGTGATQACAGNDSRLGGSVRLLDTDDVPVAKSAVTFTSDIDSTYYEYQIHFENVIPASDGVVFYMLTSTDGGSTYANSAGNYQWVYEGVSTGTNESDTTGDTGDDTILPIGISNVGSGGQEHGVSGVIHLVKPSASTYTHIYGHGVYADDGNELISFRVGGQRLQAANVDAIKFMFSSGNVESGNFQLFGLSKA